MPAENEILEGTLTRIVFQSQDNGFVIGSFLSNKHNPFTAVGNMINPEIGLGYILSGKWFEDGRFGDQFKFNSYETIMPVDSNGIFKYIVKTCKFVGSTIGNAIVDRYGENTLVIMRTEPEKIAREIKGLTLEKTKQIQQTLIDNEEIEKVLVELELILDVPGMRKALATELVKIYKKEAAEMVKVNPYILTSFNGIGFPLADKVAINIGYARNGVERKKAAVVHCIKETMQEGNVWITETDLVDRLGELIQVPDIREGIAVLIGEGKIIWESDYIAFNTPAKDERFIAETLILMEVGS